MDKKHYEKELYRLQIKLTRLQDWVKKTGQRTIVVFEGRNAIEAAYDDQASMRHRKCVPKLF